MKKMMFFVLAAVLSANLALADDSFKLLNSIQDTANKAAEVGGRIWDMSHGYADRLKDASTKLDESMLMNKILLLQMTATQLQASAQVQLETVILFLAFSEAPESAQGQQLRTILMQRVQSMAAAKEQLANLHEGAEILEEQDRALCREGIALLQASISDTYSLFGVK